MLAEAVDEAAVIEEAADDVIEELVVEAVVAEAVEEEAEVEIGEAEYLEMEAAQGDGELPIAPSPPRSAEPVVEPEPAAEPEAAEPEPEPEPKSDDPFRGPGDWYVVHTYAGYENKVKTNLESRIHTMQMEGKIFRVHIPMEDVMEIKGGKKQVVQKKVFPGYLLVKMDVRQRLLVRRAQHAGRDRVRVGRHRHQAHAARPSARSRRSSS